MLNTGLTNTKTIQCTPENTALTMGSGSLEVFATPSMIALMEGTAAESVESYLEAGQTTVGTALDVAHISATPIGMEISCESVLTEINGRELVFSVTASDASGKIGEGTHKRFIVDSQRFLSKAQKKLGE